MQFQAVITIIFETENFKSATETVSSLLEANDWAEPVEIIVSSTVEEKVD